MAKRFTDSDKWQDKWFRRLPPNQKLAYLYLLDRCDMAGTIELDRELAEFQMGCPTDWEGLVKGSEGRLIELPSGRYWVSKFIAFQQGTLSEKCNAHIPVLRLVERYNLPLDGEFKGIQRVPEPFVKGPGNSNSNSKGSSKENKKEWLVPEHLDSERIRGLLKDFELMRSKIGKPIKCIENTSRGLKHFRDEDHLAYAIEFCISNEYQGLKPEYDPQSVKTGGGRQMTFRQLQEANTQRAIEEFCND